MVSPTDLFRVHQDFVEVYPIRSARRPNGEVVQGPLLKGPVPHSGQETRVPNCVEVAQRCGGILVTERCGVQPRGSTQSARPTPQVDVAQSAKPTLQVDTAQSARPTPQLNVARSAKRTPQADVIQSATPTPQLDQSAKPTPQLDVTNPTRNRNFFQLTRWKWSGRLGYL